MSRLRVTYEWEWAVLNGPGDILSADYDEAGKLRPRGSGSEMTLYALVKDYWDEEEMLVDRTWAYIEYGALPAEFADGTKVPVRLATEYAQVLSKSYTRGAA